jgi:prepilin-type N-terminal cleavage/methylation domain-containing protein
MTHRHDIRGRSGFTLLELAVALVLFGLVVGNLYTILAGTSNALGARNASFEADVQAQRALDRIALAIVGSYEGSIHATSESPGYQSVLNYQEFLGLADVDGDGQGEEVFSDPMRIALTGVSGGDVSWFENPGEESEKHVVWVKDVSAVAQGEVAGNGVDDNGNGIVDETGLAFVKEGRSVRILLSMRRPDGKGGFLERELQTIATCRN